MYYFAIVNRLPLSSYLLSLAVIVFFFLAGIKHHSPIYMGDLYTPKWPKFNGSIIYRWPLGDAEKVAMEFL